MGKKIICSQPSAALRKRQSPPRSEESKGREPCTHCTKKTYELIRIISGIQASSKKRPRCHSCRRKRKRTGKWEPKKVGKASRQANPMWVCLDCDCYFCGGADSESAPFGHVRWHALSDKHPCAVRFNNPLVGWCFTCKSSLPMKSMEDMEMEVKGAALDDKPVYRVKGLKNIGNTCFFNSVLQNLLAMDVFWERIISLSPPEGSLTSDLQNIFYDVRFLDSNANSLDPGGLFMSVCKVAPYFGDGQQHDSHELLRFLLDGLSSCRTSSDQQDGKLIGASIVDDIFGGQLSSTVTCVVCRHASTVNEAFFDLSLSLPPTMQPSNILQEGNAGVALPNEEGESWLTRNTSEGEESHQAEDTPQHSEDDGYDPSYPHYVRHERPESFSAEEKVQHYLSSSSDPQSLDAITISQLRQIIREQTVRCLKRLYEAKSPRPEVINDNPWKTSMSSVISDYNGVDHTGGVKSANDTGDVKTVHDTGGDCEVKDTGSLNYLHDTVENRGGPIPIEACLRLYTQQELMPEAQWPCERCSALADWIDSKASEDKEMVLTSKNLAPDVDGLGHLNENAGVVEEALGNKKKSESLVQTNGCGHLQKDEEIAEQNLDALKLHENLGNVETVPCRTNNLGNVSCSGDNLVNAAVNSQDMESVGCDNDNLVTVPISTQDCRETKVPSTCQNPVSDGEGEKKKTEEKKVRRPATKRMLIKKAPHILTIHLKRFIQDFPGHWVKQISAVTFQEILDLEPYMAASSQEEDLCLYHLIGVVEHLGTIVGGHYVAYVKGGETVVGGERAWFCASDDHVREATLEEVLGCQAYILFYERVQF